MTVLMRSTPQAGRVDDRQCHVFLRGASCSRRT